jgi:outer membrane protein
MIKKWTLVPAVFCLAAVSATAVMAADLDKSFKDTPAEAYSADYGRGWMIRGRILGVMPSEDTSDWSGIAGADLSIDNSIVPELDVTYFFNRNLAIEVIAGVTPHDIEGKGSLANVDVGSAWLLPPTVMLQYHFDTGHGFKPYLGAGVNYTVFFNEDAKDVDSLDLENNWGWGLQAGVDIPLRDNWFLNVDVKRLWLDTEARVNGGDIIADVKIDPWIVGVGLGYRFGGMPDALK